MPRNEFIIGTDEYLDEHYKSLYIGEEVAPVEFKKDAFKVKGNFDLDGKLSSSRLETDNHYINISSTGYINFRNTDSTGSLDLYVLGGSPWYIASGITQNFLTTTGGNFHFGSIDEDNLSQVDFDCGANLFTFSNKSTPTSFFRIDMTETDGETKLLTNDPSGTNGNLILDIDGNIDLDADGGYVNLLDNGTKFGFFSTFAGKSGMILYESAGASEDDYMSMVTSASGATAISTVDASAEAAHLTLDIHGDIRLDSQTGNYVAKKAGTEFSVANSAYAGMILGYRMIGEDATHASYTLTTSYAVPNSDMTVRFVAPPSGAVEVMIQVYANASTSNRFLYFSLSDNATYNSLGNSYEHLHRMPDETDDSVVQHYWTVTGLTAGTTYNYWLGAKTSGTSSFLGWGGTQSGRFCDFIMKVTALPAATSDFAEYD